MGRRKTKKSEPIREVYAIVIEGQTEFWYFQMLKRNEPDLQVKIEPQIPQRKKLSEQGKSVRKLAEDFTMVYWIIDMDVVIAQGKIQELRKQFAAIKKNHDNVVTVLNNPCLEFWFLLHFELTTKFFPQCNQAEKQLKNHLPDYEKKEKYFTKQDNDIYLRLKSNLPIALKNAQKTKIENLEEIKRGFSEMNLFFKTGQIKKIIDKIIIP